MQAIKNLIVKQPALIVGLVLALLGLLSALGLVVSEEQVAAVVAFVGALLAVLGALVTRSQVTPVKAPLVPTGTDITVKDPVTGVIDSGTVVVTKE